MWAAKRVIRYFKAKMCGPMNVCDLYFLKKKKKNLCQINNVK